MKKIIIVIHSLHGGGAERVAGLLSLEWVKKYKIIFVLNEGQKITYDYEGEIIDLKIPATKNIFKKIFTLIKGSWKLYFIFKNEKPDIVISFMESASVPSTFALLFNKKIKHLISIRTPWKGINKFYRFFIKFLYHSKIIIVPSASLKNELKNKFNNLFFIPNPINKKIFSLVEEKINFKFKNYFIAVGRLGGEKNYPLLLKAFSQLKNKEIELVILGQGELESELKKLSQDLKIQERVHFLGFQSNPFTYISQATAYLMTSEYEGWPNSLAEAMALGKCCISVNCNFGPAEIINSEQVGVLVPVGEPKKLAQAMNWVLANLEKAKQMGIEAKERMVEFYLPTVAEKWEKFF